MTRFFSALGGGDSKQRQRRLRFFLSVAVAVMAICFSDNSKNNCPDSTAAADECKLEVSDVSADPRTALTAKHPKEPWLKKWWVAISSIYSGGGHGNSIDTLAADFSEQVPTNLQRLVLGLRHNLETLGDAAIEEMPTDAKLEAWACMIYESMSATSRFFHFVEHMYDISEGADPIQTLSAYWHDVVYYGVDGGLSSAQTKLLEGIVTEKDGKLLLNDVGHDPLISMVVSVFGMKPFRELNPSKGLNEFLSAAIAARCLSGTLKSEYLLRIVACIEATIPFVGVNSNGESRGEALYKRLLATRNAFSIDVTDDDLVHATQQALIQANRDTGNFAGGDPAVFLAHTWNLLPENNKPFRETRVFRISYYKEAMLKMLGFFEFLDPALIFERFRGVPDDEDYNGMISRARENVRIAKTYLRCKLLSIAVLEALAQQTGGDAPISLFVGDLHDAKRPSPTIEQYLHNSIPAETDGVYIDEAVLHILRDGRPGSASFDTARSPLGAYLYSVIGEEGLKQSSNFSKLPMDEKNAKELLNSLPPATIHKIAKACAKIATTRACALEAIAEEYAASEVYSIS